MCQLERQTGMISPEGREHRRHQRHHDRLEGRDPEGPSYVARGPRQIRVCPVESLEDRLDVLD